MIDNYMETILKDAPNAVARILFVSLLTAVFLRLANRISIRVNMAYKTAYIASLATNTLLYSINLGIAILFLTLTVNPVFAYLPAVLLSIPINALVYRKMVTDQAGQAINYKSALILSSVFIGIVFGLVFLLVGVVVGIGVLNK